MQHGHSQTQWSISFWTAFTRVRGSNIFSTTWWSLHWTRWHTIGVQNYILHALCWPQKGLILLRRSFLWQGSTWWWCGGGLCFWEKSWKWATALYFRWAAYHIVPTIVLSACYCTRCCLPYQYYACHMGAEVSRGVMVGDQYHMCYGWRSLNMCMIVDVIQTSPQYFLVLFSLFFRVWFLLNMLADWFLLCYQIWSICNLIIRSLLSCIQADLNYNCGEILSTYEYTSASVLETSL